ncbi:unnamed protein product [Pararhodospirillum photometricum DSM 122]|uniref:Uncharacterized protein n=1 Tax=Pararhodospirillum photometricum DSM 122 TaxID=1150469 RepID=H6SKS2_PARPM|nr:unnamed protein product [Pararhodospirillum photometricum DSM 122]
MRRGRMKLIGLFDAPFVRRVAVSFPTLAERAEALPIFQAVPFHG